MKVLIVFNQPAPYKVELFNMLSKKVDINVIFERYTCRNRDKLFYASNQYNFNHIFFKKGAFGEENTNTKELINHIKHNRYDLIIMNGYSNITEQRAIHYMNKKHIPWTLWINGGLIKRECIFKKMYKSSLIKTATNYLSPSEVANEYLKYYKADSKNIHLYPNSTIHESEILKKPLTLDEKNVLREKYRLPKNKKIVICPSQFIKRKNNITLLKSFVHREELLLLVGSGPLKRKYQEFIKQNSVNNVLIYDYIKKDTLNDFYRLSDAFVTLSKEDIYGHTINEAMAQGLPVISSNNVVAGKTLIKEGINGFIVDPLDIDMIYKALDQVFSLDPNESLKVARENTFEKQADVMAKIILEKLA